MIQRQSVRIGRGCVHYRHADQGRWLPTAAGPEAFAARVEVRQVEPPQPEWSGATSA